MNSRQRLHLAKLLRKTDTRSRKFLGKIMVHVHHKVVCLYFSGYLYTCSTRSSSGSPAPPLPALAPLLEQELGHEFVQLAVRAARVDAVVAARAPSAPPPAAPEKPRMSIFDRLMTVIGFRKLTDEEYLKALKKQRDEALERIAVLEQERREEERQDTEGTG